MGFCEYHMEVTVKVNSGGTHERGDMKSRVWGDKGSTGWVTLNKSPIDYQPGATYSFTVGIPSDLGHVTRVEFQWHHMSSLTDPFKWDILGLRHPTLKLDEIDLLEEETGESASFCVSGANVQSDNTLTLSRECP